MRTAMPNSTTTKTNERRYPKPKGVLDINKGAWKHRILIGHPMTGNIRVEWMMARFSQTIPTNWSHIDLMQLLSPHTPVRYQVADAENLIAKAVVEGDVEWLLFWEHDNLPPNNALVAINEYMIDGTVPVVGGLYFTKSVPPEPILYRGVGNGYFADWHFGDKVWCSAIPFGFTLIHASILKAMWAESPEYIVNGQVTRRIFDTPQESWSDPARGAFESQGGTSDLAWCKRVQQGGFFEKAGWPKYQAMKYPYLIDTGIFVKHIDANGQQFPIEVPKRYLNGNGNGKKK